MGHPETRTAGFRGTLSLSKAGCFCLANGHVRDTGATLKPTVHLLPATLDPQNHMFFVVASCMRDEEMIQCSHLELELYQRHRRSMGFER